MPLPLGYALRAWNKLVGILSGPDEESEAPESGAAVRTGAEGATLSSRAEPYYPRWRGAIRRCERGPACGPSP
jgi:hypothetical protein